MPANCDVQVSEILTRFVVVISNELISQRVLLLLLIPKLRRSLRRQLLLSESHAKWCWHAWVSIIRNIIRRRLIMIIKLLLMMMLHLLWSNEMLLLIYNVNSLRLKIVVISIAHAIRRGWWELWMCNKLMMVLMKCGKFHGISARWHATSKRRVWWMS